MTRKSGSGSPEKGAISKSFSVIKNISEVRHLDGLSELHRLDVESNWRRLHKDEAKFERESAALLESYYFGGGRRYDLIFNLWFGEDAEGVSNGRIMPGKDWEEEVMKSDDLRRNAHDGTRMRPTPDGEFSGNLRKIFARLPPWIAVAAGEDLHRNDLEKAVKKVALAFAKETGMKVLGASVHRETDHDLHVHLIVSKVGRMTIQKEPYTPSYIKTILTKQRKKIRADLTARGVELTRKNINEEMLRQREAGEIEDPNNRIVTEYRTIDRSSAPRRGLVCMGQQHCSKTNLWEASGRDPDVAAVRETSRKTSFRHVVQDAAAVAPDGDPAHKYVDFWLARRWQEAVVELLPMDVQKRMPEEGRMAAARYVKEGSSLLNPVIEAARTKEKRIVDDVVEAALGIEKFARERAEVTRGEAVTEVAMIKNDANAQAKDLVEEATGDAQQIKKRTQLLTLRIRRNAMIGAKLIRKEAKSNSAKLKAATELLMTPPGVVETAERLGFKEDGDKGFQAVLENKLYLLTHTEDKHFLSRKVEKDGEKSWLKFKDPVRHAFDLVGRIWPKLEGFDVVQRLISYFPDRVAGIVVGLGSINSPEMWKGLLKGIAPDSPSKTKDDSVPPPN